ncbi:MAG: ATP-binding protein [Candidatus Sumerlaeaceae bacterium]
MSSGSARDEFYDQGMGSEDASCATSDSNVLRVISRLQLLRSFHATFQEAQDLKTVYLRVYEMLPACLRVSRAAVLLWDEEVGALVSEAYIGAAHQNEKLRAGPQPVGFSISGLCFSEVRPVVVGDCSRTELIPPEFVKELRLKSSAAVPIVWRRSVIGVLRVDDTERTHRFSADDVEFLTVVAEQLGVVIQNARLFDSLRNRERDILRINQELAQARDIAIRTDQAKSAFLARVSHELRTPLNAILGYAEMLQEDAQEPEQAGIQQDLGRIHSAGKHLLRLIDDLLDLARIEAGKATLRAETFPIRQLVREVADLVRPAVELAGNRLEVAVTDVVSAMQADQTKVRQILLNLLGNAAKFTQNGVVSLAVDVEPGFSDQASAYAVFRVQDTGIGMTQDQMERLFEAFYQVESTDLTGEKPSLGTGLGLAISRNLCRLMGGEIAVESVPGFGTTFTVRLPLGLNPKS